MENYQEIISVKERLLELSKAILKANNETSFQSLVLPVINQLIKISGILVVAREENTDSRKSMFLSLDKTRLPIPEDSRQGEHMRKSSEEEIILQVLQSKQPIIWSMSELMKMEQRPAFLTRLRINQTKTIMAVPFFRESGTEGAVFFLSEKTETFNPAEIDLSQEIAEFISYNIIDIIDSENRKIKSQINALTNSFLTNSMSVNNKTELLTLMKKSFKEIPFIDGAGLLLFEDNDEKITLNLIKQAPGNLFGKEWSNFEGPEINRNTPLYDLITGLQTSSTYAYEEILKLGKTQSFLLPLPIYNHRELEIFPFFYEEKIIGALFYLISPTVDESIYREDRDLILARLNLLFREILTIEQGEKLKNELNILKRMMEVESQQESLKKNDFHNYIIGKSPEMTGIFQLLTKVAGTESSVLILGETGTGKELVAHAVHENSQRKEQPFIKVNCATLPANLIESELFGHERGSFTGAFERKIGKFEQANNGTLFLDEVGELPLNLQTKLLRALQEKEIERIGGKNTIKIDIRIIAATNRDLFQAIQSGSFRSDLYFRLNVFPLHLPPLRERKEDIPLLVKYFADKYGKRSKSAKYFSSNAMKQLIAYNWPGNVRELEHLIQRSVVLSKGQVINEIYLPLAIKGELNTPLINTDVKTLEEVEREHILKVLKMVNGKVSGIGGAAEMLKIPATTLSSKIIKLKIKKSFLDQTDDL
ncbi:sigma-54 interaction domain-containing protein [Mucilaginibacter kameinonensis]|uniref:sigma-54 interaction domain-containing protein n=1 Tax=Mucilaginibacter kameinonensis TaxID=452286 RepID=UPI001ABF428B|nr:sigma 54-interacting transcriptional regulator [Mucilaginibacter kameinonensis]